MKRKAFLLFVISLVIFCPFRPSINSEEDEWYPFFIPEQLDYNSPVNIGKLVLDPPAGKHGFVKVKNGHFYFEDGTRIKFWGTNFCLSACFPSKKNAEIIADRLAFFGFNAVRLHHMDYNFEPKGIFKDINPSSEDPQSKKTGILSEEQLDRLDYFIYQLKKRGIYVNINLLVSRHFTKADGIIEAEKLGNGAKPVSIFDSKMIELQKQYAKELLNHYNKYTGLKYCDEPAIALVEITNENSLSILNRKPIPEYYQKQLKKLYDDWLKENNRTKNRISKYDFYSYLEKKYFKEMGDFLKKIVNIKVPITGSQYSGISTQEDLDFIDKHAYWDHPEFPNKQWDSNDFKINNKSMLLDKNLGIIWNILKRYLLLKLSGTQKPYTITEWNHCYPNQYAYETPVLLASRAVNKNWDGLFQFAFSHGFKSEPIFDDVHSYFDTIANSQQLILCALGSFVFQKINNPKIVVENEILKLHSPEIKGISGFVKQREYNIGHITILPNEDGSVFVYSCDGKPVEKSNKLILITISEIKNTDSGWKNGKFKWGTAPTLLKKIGVNIKLTLNKNFKVYELTSEGKRGKEIKAIFKNNALSFSTQDSNSPWFEIIIKQP